MGAWSYNRRLGGRPGDRLVSQSGSFTGLRGLVLVWVCGILEPDCRLDRPHLCVAGPTKDLKLLLAHGLLGNFGIFFYGTYNFLV